MKLYSHTIILKSQHIEDIILFSSIYLLMSNLIVFLSSQSPFSFRLHTFLCLNGCNKHCYLKNLDKCKNVLRVKTKLPGSSSKLYVSVCLSVKLLRTRVGENHWGTENSKGLGPTSG